MQDAHRVCNILCCSQDIQSSALLGGHTSIRPLLSSSHTLRTTNILACAEGCIHARIRKRPLSCIVLEANACKPLQVVLVLWDALAVALGAESSVLKASYGGGDNAMVRVDSQQESRQACIFDRLRRVQV
jgi:hypothetical protein